MMVMNKAFRCSLTIALILMLNLFPIPARSQDAYPNRPVRLVIPYAPGGGTDVMGRKFATKISPVLGRTMIVDNKPGAGGTLGTVEVSRSNPDGYTLLLGTSSTHAINPWAMDNPPYDPVKDFSPVMVLAVVSMVIVSHPSVATSLKELIARAKVNKGKYSYGSAGVGSINHLTGELFKKEAGGLDIVHVPYKGSGPAVQDLIGGQIPLVMATFSAMLPFHRSGKARILAVTSDTRSKAAPDIPTAVESDLPGMVAQTFQALFTPAGTPKPIIDRLWRAGTVVVNDEAFLKDLEALTIEPVTDSNPEKAAQFIQKAHEKWGPIVKESGFKISY